MLLLVTETDERWINFCSPYRILLNNTLYNARNIRELSLDCFEHSFGSGTLRFEQQVESGFNKNPLSVHSGLVTIKADSMGICYPL